MLDQHIKAPFSNDHGKKVGYPKRRDSVIGGHVLRSMELMNFIRLRRAQLTSLSNRYVSLSSLDAATSISRKNACPSTAVPGAAKVGELHTP